jgi:cysteine desulfurase
MSTQPRIYLDHNATAPLAAAARDAMVAAMAELGNPSSVHAEGRRVRDLVERARNQVAALVGRPREQVVFTSGGTEANWLGVLGLAAVAEGRGLPRVVATTPFEHPSLAAAVDALVRRGWHRVPHGPGALPDELGLLAVGVVNHELGTFVPPATLEAARARGALVHLDAVQAAGKVSLDAIDADAIAISAHKIGGPQGIGAVVIAMDDGLPVVSDGHHERGRRPGTENTLGIVGFGAAAGAIDLAPGELVVEPYRRLASWAPVVALGERLARGLAAIERTRLHADHATTVGGTVNAGFAGALGESIVMALDLAGIAASTGAACTSGSIQPSAVLLGLGYTAEQAREGVRFSLGRTTEEGEIDAVIRTLPDIVERARRHR